VPKVSRANGLVVRYLPPTSHPAIHLREIGVPTLAVGELLFEVSANEGAEVTLDAAAERGGVYAGALAVHGEHLSARALPRTRAGIHVLAPYPSPLWSAFLRDSDVEGVHVRGESINNDDVRTHPLALLAYDDDTVDGGDRYLIERRVAGYADGASFYVAKFAERLALIRATMRPDQCLTLRLTDLQTP
jgi:phosphoenolpyruvate synthase/pyruvate phosphate dikinase